jgi:GNAT superfamily N-acetyltransferase
MPDHIRRCREDELGVVLDIINDAAGAYRGVIPADRWHEPYMSQSGLAQEIAAGVVFWGLESDGELLGVMGIQSVRDVDLVRDAYVRPAAQRRGVGAALIAHLRRLSARQMLVGTWAAAHWAIDFYRRQGFVQVSRDHARDLLTNYWRIPERQIATSVVLAQPPLG